jgi:uncharacterized protein (DUF697 family)/predicted GTPase
MGWFDRLWGQVSDGILARPDVVRAMPASVPVPVMWLLGKTGAGKTSIVAALTGDSRAETGLGFQPCTRTAALYDLPPEAPLLRFLDTRGLEESGYDPSEDLVWSEGQSHLLLAAVRVDDPAQDTLLRTLRAIRRRHPQWGLIVAQTTLHALYPSGDGHPHHYPYTGGAGDEINPALPHRLRQALAYQRRQFEALPGEPAVFVAIDLTDPADGLAPAHFGLDPLLEAIAAVGADAAAALRRIAAREETDRLRASCQRLTLGCAVAAAGAGAVPIPAVGVGGLASALATLLRGLAQRHGVSWTRANFARFTAAIGVGGLAWWGLRFGAVELAKLVPVAGSVLGGTLNAASAFSITYGISEAAHVWLRHERMGEAAPQDEVRRAFGQGLRRGLAEAPPRRMAARA